MDRRKQEAEDHILDCYAVIKENDAAIERLRAALLAIAAIEVGYAPGEYSAEANRIATEALNQQSPKDG